MPQCCRALAPFVGWLAAILVAGCVVWPAHAVAAAPDDGRGTVSGIVQGEVVFEPAPGEASLPERFQLKPHRFPYELQQVPTASTKSRQFEVRFPSPITSPHPENNTVHCEYYRPAAEGRYPATIVLHILGGDFDLMRLYCRTLAQHGVCALFIKLPYYGPRRPAGMRERMVTTDPSQTVARMTQGVLDIRRGAAWLAAQPEVDQQRLGVFGISMGGITAALASAIEPRLHNAFFMLAGADMRHANWNARELRPALVAWQQNGGTVESLCEMLRPVDPASYPRQLQQRNIRMMSCRYDEVIPPACAEALWKTCGEPPIVWLDAGHYTAMRFIFESLSEMTAFFQQAQPLPGE